MVNALPVAIGAPPDATVYQLNVPVPLAVNVAVCPEQIEALDGVTVGAEGAVVIVTFTVVLVALEQLPEVALT